MIKQVLGETGFRGEFDAGDGALIAGPWDRELGLRAGRRCLSFDDNAGGEDAPPAVCTLRERVGRLGP